MEVETLNLKEAAAFLKMSASSLRKKAKQGIVPGAKVGRDWLFIKSDIVRHIRLSYHLDVRQPLSIYGRKAQWQEKENFINEAVFGGLDSPTQGLASKFEKVRARLKSQKPSKS